MFGLFWAVAAAGTFLSNPLKDVIFEGRVFYGQNKWKNNFMYILASAQKNWIIYIFKVSWQQKVIWIWKELICLSRFWGNAQGRKEEFKSLEVREASSWHLKIISFIILIFFSGKIIRLGEQLLVIQFFDKFNFWNCLFSKIGLIFFD